MASLIDIIKAKTDYFDPYGLNKPEQIRSSPNNQFGPLVLRLSGGKTYTLRPLEAHRLGAHDIRFDGSVWKNRQGQTMTHDKVLSDSRALEASDKRYADALAARKKGFKGFVSKSVGAIVPPKASAHVQRIIETSNLGSLVTNLIRNPAFKAMALIVPVTAPFVAVATAADKLVGAVQSGDPKAIAQAVATAGAAAAGDEGAMRIAEELKKRGIDEVLSTVDKTIPGGVKGAIDTVMTSPSIKTMRNIGAHFSIPAGAQALPVAKAADKILTAVSGSKGIVAKTNASSLVKQTMLAAKKGDPAAKRGLVALAKTAQAQKLKAARTGFPKRTALRSPGQVLASVKPPGKAKLAKRPTKGATYKGGFLIDSKGIVYRGNFQAK